MHGLGTNPQDGTVYAATHTGIFRLGSGGPERVAGRVQDTMGFTVIGPDRFLGSGHPGPTETGPSDVGLIRSDDAGRTWTRGAPLQGIGALAADPDNVKRVLATTAAGLMETWSLIAAPH